ncbi:MAG: PH domain-containing protein [Prevotellaceae bacterium]|jgi:uncharacterized membrane protein YdbT with pleckstrin-like domain|nr:PH domain-containing protein [Prevotellaceae bacterium]
MSNAINTEEQAIWESAPSQWLNFKTYANSIVMAALIVTILIVYTKLRWAFCLLLLYPAGRSLFAWYGVYVTKYKITASRILYREGVFNRITKEVKLSEIREVLLIESWYKRMVGLGDIRLNLTGFSEPYIIIPGVRKADEIKELINNAVKRNNEEKPLE